MRHLNILHWVVALSVPVVHAQMQAPLEPQFECQLPEVMLKWHKPPATLATVSARISDDLAGQAEQPYRVKLQPCAAAWCKPGSQAAMLKIGINQPGRYRVAVDSMLWIDLYNTAQKLEGFLCEHSGCQPLRKIVQFDVMAGPHWVVLEGREQGEVGVLVTRVSQ